jgi:hypothetical protein
MHIKKREIHHPWLMLAGLIEILWYVGNWSWLILWPKGFGEFYEPIRESFLTVPIIGTFVVAIIVFCIMFDHDVPHTMIRILRGMFVTASVLLSGLFLLWAQTGFSVFAAMVISIGMTGSAALLCMGFVPPKVSEREVRSRAEHFS